MFISILTKNSQRSFTNSWTVDRHTAVPSGIITDIQITTSYTGPIYLTKLTVHNGVLHIVIESDYGILAATDISTPGSGLNIEGYDGTYVTVDIGFIPTQELDITDKIQIHPGCILEAGSCLQSFDTLSIIDSAGSLVATSTLINTLSIEVDGGTISNNTVSWDSDIVDLYNSKYSTFDNTGLVFSINNIGASANGVLSLYIPATRVSVYQNFIIVMADDSDVPVEVVSDIFAPEACVWKPLDIFYDNVISAESSSSE